MKNILPDFGEGKEESMKLCIEDLLKKHVNNEPEIELPLNTVIRFENGNRILRISFGVNGAIDITEAGSSDYSLIVSPCSSNKITIN